MGASAAEDADTAIGPKSHASETDDLISSYIRSLFQMVCFSAHTL